MSLIINKETLRHLAELSRLKLDEKEEEKLVKDLENILEHVSELNSVPTENVPPMTGGTSEKNAFRDDEERISTNLGEGRSAFPETEAGYLKVPPVFGNE